MSSESPAASSAISSNPASPPAPASLPTLGIEYPADHPIARRASKLQAQKEAALLGLPSATPTKAETQAAHLLEQFSTPLSMPNSPQEQARRMSINPNSRRNSILAIPPIQEKPLEPDHIPEPGADPAVDLAEIEKEIEEIDTFG